MTLDKDRKPVKLQHKVKLLGAKSPHDFFTIVCTAEGRDYFIFKSKINVLIIISFTAEYFTKPAISTMGGKRKQLDGSEQNGK